MCASKIACFRDAQVDQVDRGSGLKSAEVLSILALADDALISPDWKEQVGPLQGLTQVPGVADAARLQVWLGEAPAGPVWSKLSPREERRLDLFVAQADIVHTRRAFRVEGLGGLLRALGAGAAALSELPEADTFEATIQARIARRMPQVTRCYERELARAEGELEGRLLLEIALDARGRVDEIVVEEDSIGSATLESCVVEQTLKVRFPRPPGRVPTRFTHPFVFQRGDLGPSD